MRFLTEVHARPLSRSCGYVGLSRAAWYAPPLDWTVRDVELISALARLVEERPSRGFWKCSDQLRKKRPDWNLKRIYRVYKAMSSTREGRPRVACQSASGCRCMFPGIPIPSGPWTS